MIDLASNMNNLFKTVQSVNRITETTCLECLRNTGEHIEMTEIDRDEEVKVYPISGPETVRVNWIKYQCKECGNEVTINQ